MGRTTEERDRTRKVLLDVLEERRRQHAQWGEQNLPDGTSPAPYRYKAQQARSQCHAMASMGQCTWRHVLEEEVLEAFAETDEERLKAELVQVAAVAVQWIEAIDRRQTNPVEETMDPDANMKEQLEVVSRLLEKWDEDDGLDLDAWISAAGHQDPDVIQLFREDLGDRLRRLQEIREDAYRLAELVTARYEWEKKGGAPPSTTEEVT